ncbi:hypothetical protein [Fervidicoccus fontis]|uniref:Cell division protein CdvB n=1 Tax=Fervidicoccus fontis TaxID=683846 RepID=A0A2J6N8J2_9CREN|nr:hypothetical protein [Fervidicoccus fontis]PMB76123.1 MAG: hypothetical protein C0188_00420 [Fervidicoccus fontis]PMB77650.1 MAG: hypothetical protein C0177_02645 [Fervidicoccus fontis]HEW64411.1 hypothetical protein [Fervidicoccus fontis]
MGLSIDRDEKKAGLLGWLKNIFGNPKNYTWEDMIQDVIVRLKDEGEKFDELEYRTKKRIQELTDRIVENLKKYDSPNIKEDEKRTYHNLAKMYAEEVYELRNFLKAILFTKISFERVIQRLQTVRDYKDFQAALGPVSKMLAGVKNEISAIFPKVGETLDEINRNITDMMISTSNSMGGFNTNQTFMINEDVEKIIQEAWKLADSNVEKMLPEPKKLIQQTTQITNLSTQQSTQREINQQKSIVNKTEKIQLEAQTSSSSYNIEIVENIILNEIKKTGGKLNIQEITTNYGIDKEKIYEALYNLKKKGKIEIKDNPK